MKVKWVRVKAFEELTTTNFKGREFVTEEDLDNFVDNLFNEISEQVDISWNEFKEENSIFFFMKRRLFRQFYGIVEGHPQLEEVLYWLKKPVK